MKFTLIAAITRSNVLGNNGGMPWKSKADLARFAQLTAGKIIIMGRKTWESLPKKPLPGRLNVVISSQELDLPAGCFQFSSFDHAIVQLHKSHPSDKDVAFIIGGAQIYDEAMRNGIVDKMCITYIETDELDGDTKFDPFKYSNQWKVQNSWIKNAVDGDKYDVTFTNYEKIKIAPRKFKPRQNVPDVETAV